MSANKLVRLCLTELTTALNTNILNPPTLTGGVGSGGTLNTNCYYVIRNMYIINNTGVSATCSLWVGASGANATGTSVVPNNLIIPANQMYPWSGTLRLDVTDFLVGGSNTALALTILCMGEIGVA